MSEFPSYQDYRSTAASQTTQPSDRSVPTSARGGAATLGSLASHTVANHHPSLSMLVTPEQRERATGFLQEAYADGRLNQYEFDARLEQVLEAKDRRDLNSAFYGLVEVPTASQALGLHPAYNRSLVGANTRAKTGKASGALAHFSAFFLWIFGPLLFWMIGTQGSYAKEQARRAFNFQAVFWLAMVAVGVLDGTLGIDLGAVSGIGMIYWIVATIVGGVKASQGEDWEPWLNRIGPWEPLKKK